MSEKRNKSALLCHILIINKINFDYDLRKCHDADPHDPHPS